MFTGRSSVLVQIHNKNNTIDSKITQLRVTYKIHNQLDIGLNASNASLSGKWNEVPKWSGVTVSQLIYVNNKGHIGKVSNTDYCFNESL